MKEIVKQKIDESLMHFSNGNKELSDKLLNDAMALTIDSSDKREAGDYLLKAMGLRNKRQDVDVANCISNVKDAISLSYIAQKYFGKGRAWLYQRLNGSIVNGKQTAFTTAELIALSKAFEDLGNNLISVASEIHQSI